MSLRTYARKRDFSRTAEPKAKEASSSAAKASGPHFVIQKHDASRLHYDFRLELDGVLKSWAVPKGLPFEKGEKHMAIQVEDHPTAYANFEGIIPKGQYGGGTVMVWDTGTYESLGGPVKKDLAAGKLHFELHGNKVDGEWTLVRMRHSEDNAWLLIKSGESRRPVSKKHDDQSSLSGRSMARIARDRDAEWDSDKKHAQPSKRAAPAAVKFFPPMKATLVDAPPSHGSWIYELKFDGYRALAFREGRKLGLWSANGIEFTDRYAEIAEALEPIVGPGTAIDGEIVALDDEGRSSFQLLQALETGDERPPLAYYVFDLPFLEGTDLRSRPLRERREVLQKLLRKVKDPIRYSAEIEGDPQKLLEEVKRRGLEGLIGKAENSTYESGRRGRSWIKLKCVGEQELVIGGFTPPGGTRKHFGALLVGVYRGDELRFAGKVGTGFNEASLHSLYQKMHQLERKTCPFAGLPEKTPGRWAQNITPAEMKRCHWIDPKLVCQVRFTEWTRDGKLRHPVFLGLRTDKKAREVTREKAAHQRK